MVGFFTISMGILCLIYLICSIRTNLVFFLIFFCLVCNFALLSGAYFEGAKGNVALSGRLTEAGGAFQFVSCLLGWYIFFAIMLASVDFPFSIPRKFSLYDFALQAVNQSQLSICPL